MAAAVKKELDEMKAILEPKVNEMDNRLNGMATEISKLPGFEAKVDGVEKRLTEYTEHLAIQQAKTTELMMTEVMKVMAQMAEKDVKIAEIQGVLNAMATTSTGGGSADIKFKKDKEFFDPTKLQVDMLKDPSNWRKWKTDVEDILECSVPGMYDELRKCARLKWRLRRKI